MIAFKTFSQAPSEDIPEGIPGDYPWVQVSIQPEERASYEANSYTCMENEEFNDYVNSRQAAYAYWAATNNYGDNAQELLTTIKAEQGFQLYRQLVAMLDASGGISNVDEGLEVYAVIVPLRNMLKDGFFTYALRHYCVNIKPLNLFSTEIDEAFRTAVRDLAETYGSTSTELDALEVVP